MVFQLKLRRTTPTSIEVLPVKYSDDFPGSPQAQFYTTITLETQLVQIHSDCYVGQKAVNEKGAHNKGSQNCFVMYYFTVQSS